MGRGSVKTRLFVLFGAVTAVGLALPGPASSTGNGTGPSYALQTTSLALPNNSNLIIPTGVVVPIVGGSPVVVLAIDARQSNGNVLNGAFDVYTGGTPFALAGTTSQPVAIASGDLNGDGSPDVALAFAGSGGFGVPGFDTLDITPGPQVQGGGGTTVGNSGDGAGKPAIADLNHDGVNDLITVVPGTNRLVVIPGFHLQSGANILNTNGARVLTVGTSPQSVAIGDVNHDGNQDLIVAEHGSGKVGVLLGNGNLTFQPLAEAATCAGPQDVAAGDLNNDTFDDVVVACDSGSVAVLLSNGDGTFQSPASYPTGPGTRAVRIADMNNDGHPDVVAVSSGDDNLWSLYNPGDGSFPAIFSTVMGAGAQPWALDVADLNNDGIKDVVVADHGTLSFTTVTQQGLPDVTFGPVIPTQLTVDTTADGADTHPGDGVCADGAGRCTLRAAIQESNADCNGMAIIVPAATYALTGGDLLVNCSLAIAGVGARSTTVTRAGGAAPFRIFEIASGTASISGLSVTNGLANGSDAENNPGVGAGIWVNNSGHLTVVDSTISGNHASVSGGGVDNDGVLNVVRSTISGNSASGGNLQIGGGIDHFGSSLTVTNSTISGNTAGVDGGGVYSASDAVFLNDTIAGNTGVGYFRQGLGNSQTLQNTILAGNTLASCNATRPTSLGHNISTDDSCTLSGSGDLEDTDPGVGSLQDNGGQTDTQLPSGTGAAVNGGDDTACPTTDQRGTSRPQGSHCDVGAVELIAVTNQPPVCGDRASLVSSGGTVRDSQTWCSDPNVGDTWTAVLVGQPTHGQVTVFADSGFAYTADAGYVGADSFTVQATDSHGAVSGLATVSVTVVAAPSCPDFAFSVASGSVAAPRTAHCSSASQAGQLTYAEASRPTHGSFEIFKPDGEFHYQPPAGYIGPDSFTYEATDKFGAVSTATATITITDPVVTGNQSPVVSIASTPTSPTVGAPTTLTANASDPDGDALVLYAWSFGDGRSASGGASVAHTYQHAGTYTVSVVVTDARGATGTASRAVTVGAAAPHIALGVAPSIPVAGSAAHFLLDIPAGQAAQQTVSWTFGDGATATGSARAITHVYATAGTYSATVTETDTSGATLSATKTFSVAPHDIGPADPALSRITADPEGVLSDGSAHSTITVTLLDAWHRHVANALVTVHTDSTHVQFVGSKTATTGIGGTVKFTIKDHSAEAVVVSARDVTHGVDIAQTATVTFGPAAVHATITASPTSLAADGTSKSAVTVKLTDGQGHPAVAKQVKLKLNTGAKAFVSGAVATDASGIATFTLRDQHQEVVSITADDQTDSKIFTPQPHVTVTFTAATGGAASAATSTIKVDTQSVPADGSSRATITVTLKNAAGGADPGKAVVLHPSAQGVQLASSTATTDASGVATFTATDASAATTTFSADDTADSLTLGPTPTVTFYKHVPDASTSSVRAAPAAEPADGTSVSTVTVTLRDLGGLAVAGSPVVLHATGSAVVTSISSITNASGDATFHVADATHEHVVVSASVTAAGVSFGGTTINFSNNLASVTKSTVHATPAIVADDGIAVATISVTLLNSRGIPLKGLQVDVVGGGHSRFSGGRSGGTTDAHGSVSVTVSDSTPETVTYTVVDTSDGSLTVGSAPVTFASPVDPSHSTISASPTSVPADNSTTVTVKVTLLDQGGHPAVGRSVKLMLASGKAAVHAHVHVPNPVATDANGVATFLVKDGTAESVVATAKDVDENVTLAHHVAVSFSAPTGGAVIPSTSTVTAAPNLVRADGVRSSTITVQLRNAAGGGVPGEAVTLKASGGSSVLSPTSATTDASGAARFTVSDRKVEKVTYSATDTTDSLALSATATVNFYRHAADAQMSTVEQHQVQVAADGVTAATVTVTLKDLGGDPVLGKAVVLHAGGSGVVSPAIATTNGAGVATYSITDTVGESVFVTAVDTSDAITLVQSPHISFIQVPSGTLSKLTVNLASVATNGHFGAKITAELRDVRGALITNKFVTLHASSGHSIITQTTIHGAPTDFFTVTDTQAETVTYTATDQADGITLAQTVSVTFSKPAASSHAFITVSPSAVAADGVSTATVTVTLGTASGAPAAGKIVVLHIVGQQLHIAVPGGTSAVTDANGTATFTVAGFNATTATITAKDLSDSLGTASIETPSVTLTFT